MAPCISSSKGPKARTTTSHARAPQQVRIIGGQYKCTPLPVIDADDPRPTSDRVCGMVLSWLGHDLTDWRCADILAGTGALGPGTASHDAAHVALVENYAQAVRVLHIIHDRLGTRMADTVSGDAFAWLARQPDAMLDTVLTDPPFAQDWTLRVLEITARVVKSGGAIYVEAAQQLADVSVDSHGGEPAAGIGLPADLAFHKHLRAGAVRVHLLFRRNG